MAKSLNPSKDNRILYSPQCPDQQQHPPSLIFNRYWGSFLGAKKPRQEINHSFPSCDKVMIEGRA